MEQLKTSEGQTTIPQTFATVSDLIADISKYNDLTVQLEFNSNRYPKNFKASNIKADGLNRNRLEFELDFSDSIYSHIAVESANKEILNDGSASYSIYLKNGIGTDSCKHDSEVISIKAKNSINCVQAIFNCDLEEDECYIPETYYMDKSLIDVDKSYFDEQNHVQINVLDLNRLGILSDRQKSYIRKLMLDIVKANYKESQTFCVITNEAGKKYLGVYGLDSGRVLGKMLID